MPNDLILKTLENLKQTHLNFGLETLSEEKIERFLEQILSFGDTLLTEQRAALKLDKAQKKSEAPLGPLENTLQETISEELIQSGIKKIKERKIGCLLLAGGQGTRLGIPLSKGFAPVTPFKKKTLFQVFFEKVQRASQTNGCSLPIAILTSPLNRSAIETYLQEHAFFGNSERDVHFITQNMVPFLDQEGNWVLEAPGKLAMGPNGNGEALELFYNSGIWENWRNEGIEAVQIILIDNPLADPFFYPLVGVYAKRQCDAAILATPRRDQTEKVGMLATKNGKVAVVEYTEASLPLKTFPLANTGMFIFSMKFIQDIARVALPWHFSYKKAQTLHSEQMLWKPEKFLFDVLPFAQNARVLITERDKCFAPLKNGTGEDSFHTVRQALLNRDRNQYAQCIGKEIPKEIEVELDPAFYYPTEELRCKWRGNQIPINGSYVGVDGISLHP